MGSSDRDRSWSDEVQHRVKNMAKEDLQKFLCKNPPNSSDKFVISLEAICAHYYRKDIAAGNYTHVLKDPRCRIVFEFLENSAGFHRTYPVRNDGRLSAKHLRKSRISISDRGDPLCSYFDLFVASIGRQNDAAAVESQSRLGANRTFHCSPLTMLIWEANKEELFRGGAIYACAEYGLHELLSRLLGKDVRAELGIKDDEALEIAFLEGPDRDMTPLGVAINKGQLDCIKSLLTFVESQILGPFIVGGKNVIADAESNESVLHQIISSTKSHGVFVKDKEKKVLLVQQRAECVKMLADMFPELLIQHNATGVPPYQLAISLHNGFPLQQMIDVLYELIFDHFKDDITLAKLALYTKSGPAKELGMDLSDFNHQPDHFRSFVNSLITFNREDLGKRWQFESTLLYLNLPHLDRPGSEEIIKLLKWIKAKGVDRILSFKLPDCTASLDVEELVYNEILIPFKVVHLNWIRLDTNMYNLANLVVRDQSTPRNNTTSLTTIDIYSHGTFHGLRNDDMHQGGGRQRERWNSWFDTIQVFNLHLVDPPELSLTDLTKANLEHEKSKKSRIDAIVILKSFLNGHNGFQEGDEISWDAFTARSRAPETPLGDYELRILNDLKLCHAFLGTFTNLPEHAQLNQELRHCADTFVNGRVKVAVIDNGVDQMQYNLCQSIDSGASFVRAGGVTEVPELPWYTAADPHGTQMAYLIRRVNPWCRLLPVRVGTMNRDIDVEAAVKAIEWAIEKRVDVISISWVVYKPHQALEDAIRRAVTADILVYCTTADKGAQSYGDIYPANYKGLVTAVSATNEWGHALPRSCLDVHVMLGGERIEAEGPKYMNNAKSYITGSSGATALTAGLASLCLFLARMANEKDHWKKFTQRDTMLHIFRQMQESDRTRVISPAILFNHAFEIKDDFHQGQYPPPEGLDRLKWADLGADLKRKINSNVEYLRRKLSTESLKQTIPRPRPLSMVRNSPTVVVKIDGAQGCTTTP